jgi:PadR family transcriptional regulator, regulatory protein PadR
MIERDMGKPTDLLQGTLDLLILKTLALEPMHGWGITLRIQQISGDVLQVSPGSLYPALHRLEHQGWILAKWGETEAGRKAKYYSLTRAGKQQLEREAEQFRRLAGAVTTLLDAV